MIIKFICLNLYEGGLLFDNILEFLEQENPDIIALQEVYSGKNKNLPKNLRSIEILKKNFIDYDYHFAPEFLCVRKEGKIEIGNAIFSRFPILDTVITDFGIPYGEYSQIPIDKDFSKHPKNIHCCSIKIKDKTFNICNLHGIWGLSGQDNQARLKMSQIIVDQIKDKNNLILAGDFNLKPNTKTIQNIEKHLINLFKKDLKTSFNLSRKDLKKFPGYADAMVDMIFVSEDIQVINKYCPQVDVSDHLPLICEFKI